MNAPEIAPESVAAASCEEAPQLSQEGRSCLMRLAPVYVWWKTPEEAMHFPEQVAAQVMKLGAWEDITAMAVATGEDYLRWVLRHAEAGRFDARSWHYWHYRLALAEFGRHPVPPMPVRKIA